jgi:hypothetical protein
MTLAGLLEDSYVDGQIVNLILETFDSFLCNAQFSDFMLQKVGDLIIDSVTVGIQLNYLSGHFGKCNAGIASATI